jgi:hypothetical protein
MSSWEALVASPPSAALPVAKAQLRQLLASSVFAVVPPDAAVKWCVEALFAFLGKPPFTARPPVAFVQAAALTDHVSTELATAINAALNPQSPTHWLRGIASVPQPVPSIVVIQELALRGKLDLKLQLGALCTTEVAQKLCILCTAYVKDATDSNRDPAVVLHLLRSLLALHGAITFPMKSVRDVVQRLYLFRRAAKSTVGRSTVLLRVVAGALLLVGVPRDASAPDAIRDMLGLPVPDQLAPTKAPPAATVPAASASAPTSQKGKAAANQIKQQQQQQQSPTPAPKAAPKAANAVKHKDPTGPPQAKFNSSTRRTPQQYLSPGLLRVFIAYCRGVATQLPAEAGLRVLEHLGNAIAPVKAFRSAVGADAELAKTVIDTLGATFERYVLQPAMLLRCYGPEVLDLGLAHLKRRLGDFATAREVFDYAHELSRNATPGGLDAVLIMTANALDMKTPQALLTSTLRAWATRVSFVASGSDGNGAPSKGQRTSKQLSGGAVTTKQPLLDQAAQSDDHAALLIVFVTTAIAVLLQAPDPAASVVGIAVTYFASVLRCFIIATTTQDWREPSQKDKAVQSVAAAVAAFRAFVVHVADRAVVPLLVLTPSVAEAHGAFLQGLILRHAAFCSVGLTGSLRAGTAVPIVTTQVHNVPHAADLHAAMTDLCDPRWIAPAAAAVGWNACTSVAEVTRHDSTLRVVASRCFACATEGSAIDAGGFTNAGAKMLIQNGLRAGESAFAAWLCQRAENGLALENDSLDALRAGLDMFAQSLKAVRQPNGVAFVTCAATLFQFTSAALPGAPTADKLQILHGAISTIPGADAACDALAAVIPTTLAEERRTADAASQLRSEANAEAFARLQARVLAELAAAETRRTESAAQRRGGR